MTGVQTCALPIYAQSVKDQFFVSFRSSKRVEKERYSIVTAENISSAIRVIKQQYERPHFTAVKALETPEEFKQAMEFIAGTSEEKP